MNKNVEKRKNVIGFCHSYKYAYSCREFDLLLDCHCCVSFLYFCSEHFNEKWDIVICMLSKWIILFQFIVFQNNTRNG